LGFAVCSVFAKTKVAVNVDKISMITNKTEKRLSFMSRSSFKNK
jgi:hypothetical protein